MKAKQVPVTLELRGEFLPTRKRIEAALEHSTAAEALSTALDCEASLRLGDPLSEPANAGVCNFCDCELCPQCHRCPRCNPCEHATIDQSKPVLYRYDDASEIRNATDAELAESIAAAKHDGSGS